MSAWPVHGIGVSVAVVPSSPSIQVSENVFPLRNATCHNKWKSIFFSFKIAENL